MSRQESVISTTEGDQDIASARLADRILEDVSLTADLTDQAAQVLLDWGLAQAETLAQEEHPHPGLARLRRRMKRLSREASQAAPEDQVTRVQALLADAGQGESNPESQCHEDASTDEHML